METKEQKFTNESKKSNFISKMMAGTSFRLALIGFITLILMIPMSFVKELIREREHRKESVTAKINRNWGGGVKVYGPVLKIPFKTYRNVDTYDKKGQKHTDTVFSKFSYLYVFPENLQVDGQVKAVSKHIGIFKTAVYKANNEIKGHFAKPDLKNFDIHPKDVVWDKARIVFRSSNTHGIEDRMNIKLDATDYDLLLSGEQRDNTYYEFTTPKIGKDLFAQNNKPGFDMKYNVKGSRFFNIVPIAATTEMHMESDWPSPDFTGSFLPYNEDAILPDDKGFDAKWKVIDYQRPLQKAYIDNMPNADSYATGVRFVVPVNDYLKNNRAASYAYLVIFLTFLLFFIIQKIGKVNMHSFHYFLIGLALVVFYTLLLSISEHSRFNMSYIISAVATIGLISLYSKAILNNKRFVLYVMSTLALLYAYIYVIIQMENYALLVGSVGLFLILATIMYSSRKINFSA